MLNLSLTKTQRDFGEKPRGLGVKGHGSPIQRDALQGRFQSLKEPA